MEVPTKKANVAAFLYPNVSLRTLMLKIMTNSPIVTMISNAKLNQPSTMAVVPTPLRTLPFPKSWAMIEAATDAVCCHRTETSTNIDEMKIIARAICETGLEGNGLTSRSLPSLSSSSCHPGKVASKSKQMNAKIMAIMLVFWSALVDCKGRAISYIRYGNTIISLN